MSGLKITLPTTFSNTALPVLRDDKILSAGSLLLLEPAHPVSPWAAGIPSNGGKVPNLAAATAMAMVGGTLDQQKPIFNYSNFTAQQGLVGRTPKGGLEMVVSTTPINVNTNPGTSIQGDTKLLEYLFAHPNNDYFVSTWAYVTRPGGRVDPGNAPFTAHQVSQMGASGNNYIAYQHDEATSYPGLTNLIGSRSSQLGKAVGPMIRNVAASAFTGTLPATAASMRAAFGASGRAGNTLNGGLNSTAYGASWVMYRSYLEDLTVSGRTYAEVDAIDIAEYTKHVLTAGGRYYGDTFINPTTIP